MIFVNYKTYEQGTGKRAVELTKILESVAHETQIKIIPVVQAADIKEIVASTTLEVWTQKVDPVEFGAHTGSVVPEAVMEDGAVGTFLNHSESRFPSFEELALASDRAKSVGLKTLIFANDVQELKNISSLTPTYLSYEPAELVGSSTISVSTAKPEIIKEAAEIAKLASIPLIVGAGIKSADDIRKSLELGAAGFAVASSIVTYIDPRKVIMELTEGFK